MYSFKSKIRQFGNYGEKTGWFYIAVDRVDADKINKNIRKSYRVKGQIDHHIVAQLSLLPDGQGDFIIPFNKKLREIIKKPLGAVVELVFELDASEVYMSPILLDTLAYFDDVLAYFNKLTKSHQRYFSAYVADAKTIETQAERIEKCIFALQNRMSYNEMFRYYKDKKEQMG